MQQQPSLFGVVATDPTPEDLAGLLAGPGELSRLGGTARVSVPVADGWRVHVLMSEFAARSLPASWEGGEAGYVVRTAYTTRLIRLADAWRDGPPAGLHLHGQVLRLWVAAAGVAGPDGYLLGLNAARQSDWPPLGGALAAAGLAAALVASGTPEAPAYRITGRKRLARLAELVGDRPAAAPADRWPSPPAVPTPAPRRAPPAPRPPSP
ncbi:MAG TPA: hypothetical protein VIL37_20270 [Natronosporangium sp.]